MVSICAMGGCSCIDMRYRTHMRRRLLGAWYFQLAREDPERELRAGERYRRYL